MKLSLRTLFLTLVSCAICAHKAYSGLDTWLFSQSSGTYTALTSTNIQVPTIREYHVALPFRFRVDSVVSDSLWISVDGYAALRKGNGPITYTGAALAGNLQYIGVMSVWSNGLYLGTSTPANAAIRTASTGTAPNRVFTVDWQNQEAYGVTVNFQLKMYESGNMVQYVYGAFQPVVGMTYPLSRGGQTGLRGVDTGIYTGGVTARVNGATSGQWTATVPATSSNGFLNTYWQTATSSNNYKPAPGQTFNFYPAPACNATSGPGTLPDSVITCYGKTVLLTPVSVRDSLSYQWEASTNGSTWVNYNGGFGGIYNSVRTPDVTGTVYYRQKATCQVTSTVFYTNAVKVRPYAAQSVPYKEGFEQITASNGLPDCMVVTPGNAGSISTFAYNAHTGTYSGSFTNNAFATFITPGIALQAGKTYRFSVWLSAGVNDTLRLGVGTYPQQDSVMTVAASATTFIGDHVYRRASHVFTVPQTGLYFAGARYRGGSGFGNIDDLELREVPNTDAGVDSFIAPLADKVPCANTAVPVIIRVRNAGQQSLTNVPVYFSVNGTRYGPEYVAGIAPGATTAYTFTQTANMSGVYTLYDLKAWSLMPGDSVTSNDSAYPQTIRTDTLFAVGYYQDFNNTYYLGGVKWSPIFPLYTGVYTGFSRNNSSAFVETYPGSIPANASDSVTSSPLGPIHAKTFLTFDYRLVDYAGTMPVKLSAGDTIFVLATSNCGLTRDTLLRIHSGNQYNSDSFKTIQPAYLGAYAGGVLRIAMVVRHGSAASTAYFQWDNFRISDMTLYNAGVLWLEPTSNFLCVGGSVPVKAVLTNLGGIAASNFPVRVTLNGALAINYTYNKVLGTGKTDTVSLGSLTPATVGTHTIKVYTALSGDTTNANDSLATAILTTYPPTAPILSGKTICQGDTARISAVTNDTTAVFWYVAATAPAPVSASSPLAVSPLSTATYYGAARAARKAHTGKPAFTSSVGSGFYNGYGLQLDAVNDFLLDSMAVYPVGTGSLTVGVYSCAGCPAAATLGIFTYSFTAATGAKMMIPVGLYLPKGKGYLMQVNTSSGLTNLKRDFPFSGYPVVTPFAPVIISNGWGNNQQQYDGYYYFYDLVTTATACESSRTPVTIMVESRPQPFFSLKQSGSSVTFANGSNGTGTFLWLFGDGDSSRVSSPSHTYAANGTYPAMLIQTNICGSDTFRQDVVIAGLSVGSSLHNPGSLQLTPNPARRQVQLSFTSGIAGKMSVSIYDVMGGMVQQSIVTAVSGRNTATLMLKDLPTGIYQLTLTGGGGRERIPFVISGE